MVYQCTKYKIGQDTPQRCWQKPRITPIFSHLLAIVPLVPDFIDPGASNIEHLHLKKGVKMSSYLRTIDIDRYLNSTLSELYISDFFPTQTNLILHNIETSDYELCCTIKKMNRPRKYREKIYRWRPCNRLSVLCFRYINSKQNVCHSPLILISDNFI